MYWAKSKSRPGCKGLWDLPPRWEHLWKQRSTMEGPGDLWVLWSLWPCPWDVCGHLGISVAARGTMAHSTVPSWACQPPAMGAGDCVGGIQQAGSAAKQDVAV